MSLSASPKEPRGVMIAVSRHQNGRIWRSLHGARRLLRHQFLSNGLALYGIQATYLLFPLITMPYLARVFGPIMFGTVGLTQAAGQYVVMIVEYNFNLSATRDISRARHSVQELSRILANVILAKLMLILISAGIVLTAVYTVPVMSSNKVLAVSVGYAAASQGMNAVFYYLGLERMRTLASLDITMKALATVAVFILVKGPADAWKVFLLNALAYNLSFLASLIIAFRKVPFQRPTFKGAIDSLASGSQLFFQRCFATMYGAANVLILGGVASPLAVAYYSGADKIIRVGSAITLPVSQMFFPRLSLMIVNNRKQASTEVLRLLSIQVGGMLGLAIVLFLGAPRLVALLFGPGYQSVAEVLRILVWILPLNAVNTVLGIQWLIPLNRDTVYTRLVLAGSIMNMLLAVVLGSAFAHRGIAFGIVVSEAAMAIAVCVILQRNHISPWSTAYSQRDPMEEAGGAIPNAECNLESTVS